MSDDSKLSRRLQLVSHELSPSLSPVPSLSHAPLLYSQGSGSLSAAERSLYEQQGYVVLKGLVPVDQLQKYVRRFDQIVSGEVEKERITIMKDIAQLKDSQVELYIFIWSSLKNILMVTKRRDCSFPGLLIN